MPMSTNRTVANAMAANGTGNEIVVENAADTKREAASAFGRFIDALWKDASDDHEDRAAFFKMCEQKCEKALAEYWKLTGR